MKRQEQTQPNGPDAPEASQELIQTLRQALQGLVDATPRSKWNVRKDFSIMNAHAYASKVLFNTSQEARP